MLLAILGAVARHLLPLCPAEAPRNFSQAFGVFHVCIILRSNCWVWTNDLGLVAQSVLSRLRTLPELRVLVTVKAEAALVR